MYGDVHGNHSNSPPADVYGNHSNSPPVFQGVGGVATGVPVTQANQFYNQYDHSNQQHLHHHHHGNQRTTSSTRWSSGLCDCCSDCSNCCTTCWCPCITFGQIAEIVDEGKTSCGMSGALYGLLALFTGCTCTCMYSCFYRSRLRRQYMLQERPCNDCLVHFCCECCALCQEYRELKHLGYDMSIGWRGNVETRNREVPTVQTPTPTAPMLQAGMTR